MSSAQGTTEASTGLLLSAKMPPNKSEVRLLTTALFIESNSSARQFGNTLQRNLSFFIYFQLQL